MSDVGGLIQVVPQIAVDLIKVSEGFHRVVVWKPVVTAVPYRCPAGYWTRGYGILCQQDAGEITQEEGEIELANYLPVYMGHALRLSPVLATEGERRLSAIIDFIFNLGPTQYAASTLRRCVNERRWQDAQHQIRRWVYGGGRVLPGLVIRREADAQLLM